MWQRILAEPPHSLLKVNIRLGCWRRSGPEMADGTAGLVSSVAALARPVGSTKAYAMAVGCVVLVFAALVIASRRGPRSRIVPVPKG